MSAEAAAASPQDDGSAKKPITDAHRRVAFAFVTMLKDLQIEDGDSVEAVTSIIAQQFGIDAAGVGGQYDTGCDLAALVGNTDARVRPEDATKFKEFLELLSKKGYFKGAEEGTTEHENRMKKAVERFNARNNPFEGLTADQLKDRGNELMKVSNYKEAVRFYTKAIELTPTNHIYYANRAAAHTHLKDYRSAVIDCEKSISLDGRYSKAFSRLGTALFYESNYQRAIAAYTRALELDPENAGYQADLTQAKDKLQQEEALKGNAGGAVGAAGGGGMPGMPGMPGMEQMMSMMNNPQFMQMATQMMSNPQFSGLIANMAQNVGRTGPNMEQMNDFYAALRSSSGPQVDESGMVRTPFGSVNAEELERLRNEELQRNPRLRAIIEEVRLNGPQAFSKYMGDPEVMQMMMKFNGLVQPPGGNGGDGGGGPAAIS